MKIIIYGREGCNYCTDAVQLAANLNHDVLYHDVRKESDARAAVIGMGYHTVPQIFEDLGETTRYIGGFDEYQEEVNS